MSSVLRERGKQKATDRLTFVLAKIQAKAWRIRTKSNNHSTAMHDGMEERAYRIT
jgi:hypothetical protein